MKNFWIIAFILAIIALAFIGCQATPGSPEANRDDGVRVGYDQVGNVDGAAAPFKSYEYITTKQVDAVAKTVSFKNGGELLKDPIVREAMDAKNPVRSISWGQLQVLALGDADVSAETKQAMADRCSGNGKCYLRCGSTQYIITGVPNGCRCIPAEGSNLTIDCSDTGCPSKYLVCSNAQ